MGWLQNRIEKGKKVTAKNVQKKLGFHYMAGVSFNGKLAIAGPVTAAVVILDPEHDIQGITSATEASPTEQARLFRQIRQKATTFTLGWGAPGLIYKKGLYVAQYTALRTALDFVFYNPASVVIISDFEFEEEKHFLQRSRTPYICHKYAERSVEAVMAASIVAKTARETLMAINHRCYPEYSWNTNFGFATPQHLEAIKEHGITPEHRDLSNIKSLKNIEVKANVRRC